MRTSTDRILTTHTGSLPRPATLVDLNDPGSVRAAVQETVDLQRKASVDVFNDGEVSKPSYASYVTERLSGFDGDPAPRQFRHRAFDDFPEFYEKQRKDFNFDTLLPTPTCSGPVAYVDRTKLEADIANVKACGDGAEVFMTAASPGIIAGYMANGYYPSTEEYITAVGEAMKEEYDAIYQAGIVLQLDCPDLTGVGSDDPDLTIEDFRKLVAWRLEVIDYALRDIPPERVRLHVCWGNAEGPHHTDVPLAHMIDLLLGARPAALLVEGANPRHEHEWKVFEDVKLPEGKVIIPGVLDSTTNFIEHPELVAQRLVRYAQVVGKTNVMAGTDCGFATIGALNLVDPKIAWAKLAAMAEGAQLASTYLWG